MMMLQLNPAIPVFIKGRGPALAHVLIDYGIEHDLMWTCFVTKTGECWTVSNRDISGVENNTIGSMRQSEPCVKPSGKRK